MSVASLSANPFYEALALAALPAVELLQQGEEMVGVTRGATISTRGGWSSKLPPLSALGPTPNPEIPKSISEFLFSEVEVHMGRNGNKGVHGLGLAGRYYQGSFWAGCPEVIETATPYIALVQRADKTLHPDHVLVELPTCGASTRHSISSMVRAPKSMT
jgi:hypothetical protein